MNEKKTILILIMGCRKEFFQKQIRQIYSTWGRIFQPHIDIMWYDGDWSPEEAGLDEDNIHIKCPIDDSIEYTFVKTVYALTGALKLKNYDYILRVNTSTWINIPLLDKFVQEIAEPDVLYAPELYSLSEAPCPLPCDLYARGNVMLIPNKLAGILCQYGLPQLYTKMVDDVAIGNTLNSWWGSTTGNLTEYEKHIKGLPFGWYKASPHKFYIGHQLCMFGEEGSQEFYNRFIAVQTKQYRLRGTELENMQEFYELMKDAPEPSLNLCIEYMKNPSIFIGSILGYIDYKTWKSTPREHLLYIEKHNKAIDDKENPNYIKEEYDRLHSLN